MKELIFLQSQFTLPPRGKDCKNDKGIIFLIPVDSGRSDSGDSGGIPARIGIPVLESEN